MIVNDKIYGRQKINDQVLIELIKSSPVQRLKHVSQFGIPNQYYFLNGYSRYEHSVGVMILLKKYGATLEEQVAGLLHDISHFAFSHVADWVFGHEENEDLQDSIHAKSFTKTQIANILLKHGYKPNRIATLEGYRLLDREIPDLCADRIDYSFREFETYSDKNNLKYCLDNLTIYNQEFVFKNKKSAKIFANTFITCQLKHWGCPEAKARYQILSDILKDALRKKLITKKDFLTDDQTIISKIKKSKNYDLNQKLKLLEYKKLRKELLKKLILKKKFRYVDPKFIHQDRISRLSEKDATFKRKVVKLLNIKQGPAGEKGKEGKT